MSVGEYYSIYHYCNALFVTNVPAEAFFSEGELFEIKQKLARGKCLIVVQFLFSKEEVRNITKICMYF